MTIFVVFHTSDRDKLAVEMQRQFPDDHLSLNTGEWLVSAALTAKEVTDRLKIASGESGSGIVFAMSTYYGRSDPNIWEWIKVRTSHGS